MAEYKKRSIVEGNNGKNEPEMHEDVLVSDSQVEDVVDMLDETNDIASVVLMGDEVADPDINVLAQQEEENLDEDVLDLKNPQVLAELSEDPVRLYLREIGEVKLLDSDSEFRLATLIEANR